jgi:hypothetical protein
MTLLDAIYSSCRLQSQFAILIYNSTIYNLQFDFICKKKLQVCKIVNRSYIIQFTIYSLQFVTYNAIYNL